MGRRARADEPELHGVLVVDKPAGLTSHDVVARVRRRLGRRRVGHAGTLDPMATGVLVVMVGEATKLGPYLSGEDKAYLATVSLGQATDTLDAEGEVTARAPLPAWWAEPAERAARVEAALDRERKRRSQQPPRFSAIKVGGRAAHARARAGEAVELAERPVEVRQLELVEPPSDDGRLELSLTVSKGYYVRSLARDLGDALGVPAHLAALRRTASGRFTLAEARPLDQLGHRLLSLSEAASRALPVVRLTPAGAERARFGGPMAAGDFENPPPERPCAWLDPAGRLVAVGAGARVLRGFATRG